jgi:hypothetical protein
MRNFNLGVVTVLLLTSTFNPRAFGQTNGCGDLQEKGVPGRIYVQTTASGFQDPTTSRWKPLSSTLQTNDGVQEIQLGYLVPATQGSGETGSLIIKIARQNMSKSDEQAAPSSHIRLFRRSFTTTCKGRYFSDWFGSLVRPEVSADVSITDYIYYHKTDADSGQPEIYDFHVDYRDKNGNCVSTDDKRNGNRQQFLFTNRTREEGLVLANIKANLDLVATAYSAPGYVSKVLADKDNRVRELVTGYLKYSKLETQLHQYKIPDAACVLFSIQNPEPGENISIRLNNLEQRDANGRFLPASERKERQYRVQLR